MFLVGKNPEFGEQHHFYSTRKNNSLKKMQLLMAVVAKLIRVFYAMLTKGVGMIRQRCWEISSDRQYTCRLCKK